MKTVKTSELKPGMDIIFKKKADISDAREYENGTIISIDREAKYAGVNYLEGYKDRHDFVPLSDIAAVYDKEGEHMRFGAFSGPSAVVEQEETEEAEVSER